MGINFRNREIYQDGLKGFGVAKDIPIETIFSDVTRFSFGNTFY